MSVQLWLEVLNQATQDADNPFPGNEPCKEARRWLELPEYRANRELVCSLAGVSVERLDALVRSKSWYGQNHGEPLNNRRECSVCQKMFTPLTNFGKLCSPECRKISVRRRSRAHKRAKRSRPPERACSVCRSMFTPRNATGKLCSPECRKAADLKRTRDFRRAQKAAADDYTSPSTSLSPPRSAV